MHVNEIKKTAVAMTAAVSLVLLPFLFCVNKTDSSVFDGRKAIENLGHMLYEF